jgi:hypothetical protein
MNIYHTFYNGLFEEVEAENPLAAQKKAAGLFLARLPRKRKLPHYDVAVVLCAVNGRTVEHSTSEI